MFKWTQDLAADELRALITEIPQLREGQRFSANHSRWVTRTLAILEQVFGQNSRYYLSFAALTWQEESSFIFGGPSDPEGSWNPQAAVERRHHQAFLRHLEAGCGFLQAALEDLERRGIAAIYDGKDTPAESSALVKIIKLAERKLRKAVRDKPDREKQVQDAFETLLVGADIHHERETDSIIYSSKTYTPDFSFRFIDLALELKLCSRADREKEIIAEINDDILAYKTKYRNLIFVVYDLGFIRDVDRFTETFENIDGVIMRVVKH
jgi:arsenate reductase-like glutaredoxin family protein